jgi:hypothetical protein
MRGRNGHLAYRLHSHQGMPCQIFVVEHASNPEKD